MTKRSILLLFIIFSLSLSQLGAQMITEQTLKFGRVMALINAFYVDSASQEQLTEIAIREVLKELDPHSVYIPEDELQEINQRLQGSFEGIGIEFNVLNDSILVISPMPGGPSEKVGLRPGDRIVTIDGENVAGTGITTNGVRDRLLGDKGTTVRVGVYRRGVKDIRVYDIVRDELPVNSLLASYIAADGIGYIKLRNFSLTTEDEFNEAIDDLLNEDMRHLVLDLRGNTGGYLEAAIRMCDNFFSEKKLIVYLEGLNTERQEFYCRAGGNLNDARIVVLVDEGSASASEIVAGAVQEWDRGLIMGRRTFGKGLVQNAFKLGDGSALRLTIARYHTPTGRMIQRPYDQGVEKYMSDFYERFSNGELVSADSVNMPDSLRFSTLVNGRPVYGGGGIMPDIFLPVDTSEYSDYYRDLINKNVITRFSLDYVDRNRKRIENKYNSFDHFNQDFNFADKEMSELITLAEEMGVSLVEDEYAISEKAIRKILKGLVARDIWDMSEYYEIVNSDDEAIEKAIEMINERDDFLSYLRQ
ncbi:MAG: PDZ domain-containing protein [Bacteroidales bacterium]|nr:PDZ domain-containing protein [Bacteroidales bacterium]